jgi:hypothetical protein
LAHRFFEAGVVHSLVEIAMKTGASLLLFPMFLIIALTVNGQQNTASVGRPSSLINGFAIPQRSQATGGGCRL